MVFFRLLKILRVFARYRLDQLLPANLPFAAQLLLVFFKLFPTPRSAKGEPMTRGECLRRACEDLGPIFVKFGQLLSTRPDLVPADLGASGLGFNAHVWLDPLTMAAAIPDLVTALTAVAPAAAEGFAARGALLHTDLIALHDEIAALLAPFAGAPFVPFHDAWPYFAARYHLDLIVEIEPFPGREPSPSYLRTALAAIRTAGVRVIFTETQLQRRPAEVVAAEAGVALAELDPLGGLPGRLTYQDLLRFDAQVLATALATP